MDSFLLSQLHPRSAGPDLFSSPTPPLTFVLPSYMEVFLSFLKSEVFCQIFAHVILSSVNTLLLLSLYTLFVFFKWLYLWHMEVPG